jgi:peptide/nickel transport system substrate-binding protein
LARLTAASALAWVLLVLSACGGQVEGHDAERNGGTLTMLAASDVDFLDPGRVFFTLGAQVLMATQRPLYSYRGLDLTKPVSDLASGPPTVSPDGLEITIDLRRGVRFSPPVNRAVTSRDVAYAFERFFSINVGGPYPSYFSDLVGAPTKPTKGVRPISGITTPDDHTIVFRLRRPTSAAFIGALALAISVPVPEEYAKQFDAHSPSTYNEHVVATGPYMVRNDAKGNTVGYKAGSTIDLVRNPNWRRATDNRAAYVDAIRIRTSTADSTISARQVLAGSHRILNVTPPAAVLKDLSEQRSDQGVRLPVGGYRFVPINTTIKPFDNLDVRKAVLAVFDRNAARLARGGEVTGPLATHLLPPGISGYEEAGGARGPGYDFLDADQPHGDPALATKYMKKAGYSSGKYTGDERFLAVAGNTSGEKAVAEVVQAQLAKLGFRLRLRIVPDDALFTSWCSVPSRKVVFCASGIAWLKDFPDPQPMLQPVFDGGAIVSIANNNFSQLNNPQINAAMARAQLTTGKARSAAWGAVDRMIAAQAPVIPLQWDVATLIRSKDVVGVPNAYLGSWDLTETSLK